MKRDQILQEAEKLAARGKLDAAIKEYRRALEHSPHDTNTLNRLGDLLVRVNRIPEAIDVYERIADHFSSDGFFLKAIAIYKKVNRLDPQRTEIYERLADLYFKQGLVVEGRQQLVTLADWFLRSKDNQEAVRVYRRLAELDSGNVQARAKLVDLLAQLGDAEGVAAEIDGLGRSLLSRGMLDEAVKLYHRALELKPERCDFIAPCIDALVKASRASQAVELARSALAIAPKEPELRRAAAAAYADAGEVGAAKELLEGLMSSFGDRTDVVQLYGDVMVRVGETEGAKERVLPAVDRLLKAGELVRAATLLKRLVQSSPGDIEVLERARNVFTRRDDPGLADTVESALAEAYCKAGRAKDALALYRDLAGRDPSNALYAERLRSLSGGAGGAVAAPAEPQPHRREPAAIPAPPPPAAQRAAAVPEPEAASPVGSPNEEFEPGFGEADIEIIDVDLAFEDGAGGVARDADVEASPPTAPQHVATSAEELYTEAAVFAKYGLNDKAIAHLQRLLSFEPGHAPGRELLVALGGAAAEPEPAPPAQFVAAVEPPVEFEAPEPAAPVIPAAPPVARPAPAAAQPAPPVAGSVPPAVPPAPPAEQPSLDALASFFQSPSERPATSARSAVGPVKLEDLEAMLGLSGAPPARQAAAPPARPAPAPPAPPVAPPVVEPSSPPVPTFDVNVPQTPVSSEAGFEVPSFEWSEIDLALPTGPAPEPGPRPVEPVQASAPPPIAPPEPAVLPPPPPELEEVAEPVELLDVAEVLDGPGSEQLAEVDFFIQQGVLDEAARLLQTLRESFPEHPDVMNRQALLKARGWDEQPQTVAETTAEALFSEEDEFFDLAAELEKELADDELVAEARGSGPAAGEVSIEDLFKEFQRGVAEQVNEEDYDTHFNLGLAYREMGLLDEAVGEFQLSAKSPVYFVESASMIGACYIDKGLPEQAVEWFERALSSSDVPADTEIGLRYELAHAQELAGNIPAALANYAEVLAVNPGFRDVVNRVAALKAN